MTSVAKPGCSNVDRLRPEEYEAEPATKTYSLAERPGKNWGQYLIAFVVITLIAWIVLYFLKPAFLQTKNPDGTLTGQVDNGRTLATAVIIGIIGLIIWWLVARPVKA